MMGSMSVWKVLPFVSPVIFLRVLDIVETAVDYRR
jgi:hypothetical protein